MACEEFEASEGGVSGNVSESLVPAHLGGPGYIHTYIYIHTSDL